MKVLCSSCGQVYTAPEKLAGEQVKCKKCGNLIDVPGIAKNDSPSTPDDPLRSFFDQELPPDEIESAPAIFSPTSKSHSTLRPAGGNFFGKTKNFVLGLISFSKKKPVRASWAAVIVALLVGALLWLVGFWQLGMLWGSACSLFGVAMGILMVVGWFKGPRPKTNWGEYSAFVVVANLAVFLVLFVGGKISPEVQVGGAILVGVCALLYQAKIFLQYPPHIRNRIFRFTFMSVAALIMLIGGGLIRTSMFTRLALELHSPNRGRHSVASRPATQPAPQPTNRQESRPPQSHQKPKPTVVPYSPPPRQSPPNTSEHPSRESPTDRPPSSSIPPSNIISPPPRNEHPAPETRKPAQSRSRADNPDLWRYAPTPAADVPDVWLVHPDPLPERISVSSDLLIHPRCKSGSPKAFYPATPSRFVAIGNTEDRDDTITVWDCASMKQTGEVNGSQCWSAMTLALSADGKYIACRANRQKAPIKVCSCETDKATFNIPLPDRKILNLSLRFAGLDCLVAVYTTDDYKNKQRVIQAWSVPEGNLLAEYEVEMDNNSASTAALSPTGKYIAFAGRHLMIHETASGKLVGTRPYPGSEGDMAWTCQGTAFSPDGTELVALFSVSSPRRPTRAIIVWNLTDGSVVVNHNPSDNRLSNMHGFFSSRVPLVQWMEEGKGWLIRGDYAIDRKSGKECWRTYSNDDHPCSLIDGRHLLTFTRTGLCLGIIACEVSPTLRPDTKNHPAVSFKASFLDTYNYKWHMKAEILDYQGNDDLVIAAAKALEGVERIDTTKIELDKLNNVLVVGFTSDKWCDRREAKKALEKAGFKVGRTTFDLSPRR